LLRLLSRFLSQGFQAGLSRISVIEGPGAQPRVVLMGRLAVYGAGAAGLHEEIIPVTAIVEPVCKGIAEQGGLTFRDPRVELKKRNCVESERTIREHVVKQWSSFSADDRRHCVNVTTMGGLELHRVAHLSGNGAGCASHEG
jgi:hypothetical protein